MEHFSRAPAVIAAPAPVVEHIAPSAAVSYTVPLAVYAVLAPVAELSLQRLRASAPVVEYIAAVPAVNAALRCAGEPIEATPGARGPLTKTGMLQDTWFLFISVKTRSSRHGFVTPSFRPHC